MFSYCLIYHFFDERYIIHVDHHNFTCVIDELSLTYQIQKVVEKHEFSPCTIEITKYIANDEIVGYSVYYDDEVFYPLEG